MKEKALCVLFLFFVSSSSAEATPLDEEISLDRIILADQGVKQMTAPAADAEEDPNEDVDEIRGYSGAPVIFQEASLTATLFGGGRTIVRRGREMSFTSVFGGGELGFRFHLTDFSILDAPVRLEVGPRFRFKTTSFRGTDAKFRGQSLLFGPELVFWHVPDDTVGAWSAVVRPQLKYQELSVSSKLIPRDVDAYVASYGLDFTLNFHWPALGHGSKGRQGVRVEGVSTTVIEGLLPKISLRLSWLKQVNLNRRARHTIGKFSVDRLTFYVDWGLYKWATNTRDTRKEWLVESRLDLITGARFYDAFGYRTIENRQMLTNLFLGAGSEMRFNRLVSLWFSGGVGYEVDTERYSGELLFGLTFGAPRQ